uniref:Protein Asterix n=1 Tax=Fibrocapsa japonica TaxID=94617 RepID=A0A7S2Y0W3_9STRA|mmetsp:Transcript_9508/g.14585  ORF Transcript_9508/g.14585 Transcript_9508/m.14585 type:complete len:106 (+) Transcript_9508:57-374(+)
MQRKKRINLGGVENPRNPNMIRRFYREKLDPDQLPPDYIALLSLVFGIMGLMLKYKLCAWLSVFCCMSSMANIKNSEMDIKQIACSVMFAMMGLFMNYFGPTPKH